MTTSTKSGSEKIMAVSPLAITAGMVTATLGWWAVHALTLRRDREKFRLESLKADLGDIGSIIGDLIELSSGYHCSYRDIAKERSTLSLLTKLPLRIQSMPVAPNEAKEKENLLMLFNSLKRAITGSHFDDEHSGPLLPSSEQLSEIHRTALELEMAVLSLRNLCYMPNNLLIINFWSSPDEQYKK